MAFVDHCQTAEDVRRNAEAVRERRRTVFGSGNSEEFEKFMLAYLKSQQAEVEEQARQENLPPPPPPPPTVMETVAQEAINIQVPNSPRLSHLQKLVAKAFGITLEELLSQSRKSKLVLARQTFYALARQWTVKSFPEIGRATGGRDHSTIVHGARSMEWLREALRMELSMKHPVYVWVARSFELVKARNPHVFKH